MEKQTSTGIIVRCPNCEWRILDKITPTSGNIKVKCPKCGKEVVLNLSLRKSVHYRTAKLPITRTVLQANILEKGLRQLNS